jgi:hypothetical protein
LFTTDGEFKRNIVPFKLELRGATEKEGHTSSVERLADFNWYMECKLVHDFTLTIDSAILFFELILYITVKLLFNCD